MKIRHFRVGGDDGLIVISLVFQAIGHPLFFCPALLQASFSAVCSHMLA
jgi:hypothetical protein